MHVRRLTLREEELGVLRGLAVAFPISAGLWLLISAVLFLGLAVTS